MKTMKVMLLTNEYPPNIYGGAGVHVDYLTKELANLMEVDVRCFGDQADHSGALKVTGFNYDANMFKHTESVLKSPLSALNRCISFVAEPSDAQIVHCHTWYTAFGGVLAKMSYGFPLVITTHSLEPLRPWKREQIGNGYDISCWIEKTALEMADAIIAVSRDMKEDIVKIFSIPEAKVKIVYNGVDIEE
jgi:starch synthase